MFIRIFVVLFCTCTVGFLVHAAWGTSLGWGSAMLMVLLWIVVNEYRASQLIEALRADPPTFPAKRWGGLWGELVDRVRRLLRNREQQFVQSSARLDEFLSAIQASPNGVVLLDDQSRIEWCNSQAALHFGFDAERDKLQHITNLVRSPLFINYLVSWNYSREVVLDGPPGVLGGMDGIQSDQFSAPGVSGSGGLPLRFTVQAFPYAGRRRLLLTRDITAVEQAEVMRRDFVANVSHEIRTPLTVMSGFVETLQNLPLSEDERRKYLDLMSQQAARMQTLVNDLLTLSKLEGSPLPPSNQWLSVRKIAETIATEAQGLSHVLFAGQAEQDLAFEAVDAEIAGAAPELQSALSNLVSNAVRYTPPGGRVQVTWRWLPADRGAKLEFAVLDSGAGISAEHLPRLTERFYRVDRSRSRETGGTGLGLAIVKHVAQRHGATLNISSNVGQGSRFALVFPSGRVRHAHKAPL